MATATEIRQRLQEMAGASAPDVSVIAQVSAVDPEDCTCTLVDDGGLEFFNVRLRPITGENKSLLQIPKIGSFVLAVRIESTDEWMVLACDEVEKVQLIVGQSEIIITENDVLMNGGKLGGLIKISELTAKLNELVNKLNTHTHVVATTGTATAQTGTASATLNVAQPFRVQDYEDKTIKH